MKTFRVELQEPTRKDSFASVLRFHGEDDSGQFSIRANRERFITVLSVGLARFELADQTWRYVALPEAVLSFRKNTLRLTCRRFFLSSDMNEIQRILNEQSRSRQNSRVESKRSVAELDQAILRRLSQNARDQVGL